MIFIPAKMTKRLNCSKTMKSSINGKSYSFIEFRETSTDINRIIRIIDYNCMNLV